MATLRVGIVGMGFMGRSYGRLIRQHPGAELAGVAEIDAATGARAADELATRCFPSAEALIAATHPDALIVATVEHAHRQPCVAALSERIAVLVEKPIATTEDDGHAIVQAARNSGALLMVGHVLRFDPRYVLLQQTVAAGEIGEPLTISARRLNGRGAQNRLRGRCSLPVFLGVHDYDAVRWIVGSEITHVFAQSHVGFLAGQGYPVEDATWALLTFANGALGAVEEGWILPDTHPSGFEQRLEITGTKGRVELADARQDLTIMTEHRAARPDTGAWPVINGQVTGALAREVDHFLDCVRHGQPPLVNGEAGLTALRIALAVEESARTHQQISLG